MKKELEEKRFNNMKKGGWQSLVLKICLLPAILMLDLARAISIRTKGFDTSLIRSVIKTLMILFVTISLVTTTIAIPTTINLQGKLMSDTGSSLTGTHNITFKIYDAFTGGNLLYESENNVTLNSRGVYDVTLKDINLSFNEQYYLGIRVNTNTEMTPRINLSSMPYAFRANTSDDLNKTNRYTIGNLNVTNNITIGDSAEDLIEITSSKFNVSTTGNLDIAGNLTLAEKITFALGEIIDNIFNGWIRINGGLNVTGDVVLGTSTSDNLTVNAYIASDLTPVDNARDLGSPSNFWKYLYVDQLITNNLSSGAVNISGTSSSSFIINNDNPTDDTEDVSLVYERGTPTTNAVITWDSTNKRFDLNQKVYLQNDLIVDGNTSINNTLYVTRDGKVGINTSSPLQELVVVGDLNVTGTSYLSDITISADNITTNGIISKDGNISFYNNTGDENVRITESGNVGIGTTGPVRKFQVSESSTGEAIMVNIHNPSNTAAQEATLAWSNMANGDVTVRIAAIKNAVGSAATSLDFRTHTGSVWYKGQLYLKYDGNVGIGTTNPLYRLSVANTSSAVNLSSVLFVKGDTERVGIGTSSPLQTLNVVGDLNVTGTSYFGSQSFTNIDATGNLVVGRNLTVGSTNLFVNNNTGRVGIGTTSPVQKLDVVGHINITGTTTNSTFEGDVQIKGTLYGGTPLEISGGINLTSGNLTDGNGTVLNIQPDMIAIFDTNCPTGWTRVTALDNKFLVANASYDVARGGSDSVTLTTANLPTHFHNTGTIAVNNSGAHAHAAGTIAVNNSGAHAHSFTPAGTVSQPTFTGTGGTTGSESAHTHGVGTLSADSAGSHTHAIYNNIAGGANYVFSGEWGTQDTSATAMLSAGAHTHTISGSTDAGSAHSHSFTPAGTVSQPTFTGTGGTTGSEAAHTHAVTGSTGSEAAHTHAVSGATDTNGSSTAVDNRPAFATVVICKKDVGSDYAEWIKSKEQYKPGTIVSADPNAEEQIKISEKPYDSAVLGIISTAPGWIVGRENENSLMMALSGRVSTIVAIKEDKILPGDAITTSSLAGVGMKATKPGPIVGKALESFEAMNKCRTISSLERINWSDERDCFKLPDNTYIGKIIVLVSVSYWEPENYEEEQDKKIETNTETIKNLKQQIENQQVEIEQLKSIIYNNPEVNIIKNFEGDIKQKQSTENLHSWQREYPEIKEMFKETGSDLKSVLEDKGYKVTHIERNKGEGFSPIYKNYALVAIEKKGLENIFDEGHKISEDTIPYIKSYYPDSEIWMIFIHDTSREGKQVQCIFSTPELRMGGCTETPSWDSIFTKQGNIIEEKSSNISDSSKQCSTELTTEKVDQLLNRIDELEQRLAQLENQSTPTQEQSDNTIGETETPTNESSENVTETNITEGTQEENITESTNQTEPINNPEENTTDQGFYNIVNTMTATIISSGLINYIVLFLLI